ncbi:hypothetical protein FA13DRAFT_1101595 [Coprinellus micaceus]|uniref:Uncharacterized protein n=1 Tax=Coprinellus micaceus TaxID=71717 RepID=A0A4Y7SX79_COPMI|nr:hypothetical protein FA13DRAFT_1101595 [Coprinellus micaceus]
MRVSSKLFSSPPHELGKTRPVAVAPLSCAGFPYAYCGARPGVLHSRVNWPYRALRWIRFAFRVSSPFEIASSAFRSCFS